MGRRPGRIPNGGYTSSQIKSVYRRLNIDDSFMTGKEKKEEVQVVSASASTFNVITKTGEYKAIADSILVDPKKDPKKEPIIIDLTPTPIGSYAKTFLTAKDGQGVVWGRSNTYNFVNIKEDLSVSVNCIMNDALVAEKTGFNPGEEFYLFFNYTDKDSVSEVYLSFSGSNTALSDSIIEVSEFIKK